MATVKNEEAEHAEREGHVQRAAAAESARPPAPAPAPEAEADHGGESARPERKAASRETHPKEAPSREPTREKEPARDKEKRTKNNVRKIRIERMMSKAELARRAGVSTLTIDRVENGLPCRMDTKRKILEALGLNPPDRVTVFGEDD